MSAREQGAAYLEALFDELDQPVIANAAAPNDTRGNVPPPLPDPELAGLPASASDAFRDYADQLWRRFFRQ